ncbi:hypothetical protein [Bacillus salacetis]|uniref:hypothetical protein n=1 Tax=Bacillus salacetis TaxID=2315464 RepID=UPI0014438E75|nr:hypothetical protein [Bacillus salacetis]
MPNVLQLSTNSAAYSRQPLFTFPAILHLVFPLLTWQLFFKNHLRNRRKSTLRLGRTNCRSAAL